MNRSWGKEKRSGFTTTEIFLIVALFFFLAAIAIPGILQMRITGYETAAQLKLRILKELMEDFRENQTPAAYPEHLKDLSDADPPYISEEAIVGVSQGYSFTLALLTPETFLITATPDINGARVFTIGNEGTGPITAPLSLIEESGPTEPAPPPVEEEPAPPPAEEAEEDEPPGGGGGGGGGCFVAGTLVLTEEGLKPIESLKIGEKILSKNLETGALELKKITRTFETERDDLAKLSLGRTSIVCSNNHRFFKIGGSFHEANELKKGELLLDAQGKSRPLRETELLNLKSRVKVYNLTIQDNHTYFVSSEEVLVHNIKDVTGP
ncbi:MAG: hypothetical protein HY590_07960 [Candidatus Omnitrophica bacterium]|nr:hypothetical protein [Candidatus Omnitrophota bacterium]